MDRRPSRLSRWRRFISGLASPRPRSPRGRGGVATTMRRDRSHPSVLLVALVAGLVTVTGCGRAADRAPESPPATRHVVDVAPDGSSVRADLARAASSKQRRSVRADPSGAHHIPVTPQRAAGDRSRSRARRPHQRANDGPPFGCSRSCAQENAPPPRSSSGNSKCNPFGRSSCTGASRPATRAPSSGSNGTSDSAQQSAPAPFASSN
jgi:hypothetical protein